MAEEEYEILPHKLLSDLKFDVEALKKKLTDPDTKTNELILEIESMKDSVHELNTVFEKALEMTKGQDLSKLIFDMNQKLEAVVNQNETIARGMIAISDKLEDFMQRQSPRSSPSMASSPGMAVKHTMGPPQSTLGRTAPKPQGMMEEVPPPPPGLNGEKKKRVGLF
ncbi:MAG: hypothetical protein KKA62_00445 [Nanoarchaeota archaeon]|nr:hypothetical protein [Nanoarchaeota archaeon]MBU1643907.1 hypothetical protein [Nanoarchaeota archaeon]MBU1976405.1 hypothetical protein [Nanoarchaeota archaeon]